MLKKSSFLTNLVEKHIKIFLNILQKILGHTVGKKRIIYSVPFFGMFSLCLRTRLQKSINSNISFCKIKIIFKSSTLLSNFYRFKGKIPLCLRSNIAYNFACGRCNVTSYGEIYRHFKVRVGENSGISPLTNKRSKSKISTAVKEHMMICNQPVSFDDFKVLASSNSEFNLKIKESLLILRDQPILNKNLCHYICFISYTSFLQAFNYLVSSFIHCYLLFVVFSNKIYAPVSFKIVLKVP